jgi:hypothetical protein
MNYIIKNKIKRIPKGMQLNRKIYYISSPVGLISKVYKHFDQNEAFGILRIISYIRIAQKQYTDGKNLYVNIPRNIFVACAGKKYRSYINWLIDNNIIQVNESYSTTNKFSKSYRYTDSAYSKPLSVTKWYIDVLSDTDEIYNEKIKETVFTPNGIFDNTLLYCLEHENLLSIPNPEEIIDSLPIDEKSYASEWFYEINKGKCFPSPQSKSTRFYFNSIMMSSNYRKYLVYNKTETLVNYDIKTAYPAFTKLLSIYSSPIPTYVFSIIDEVINNNNSSYPPTYVFSIFIELGKKIFDKDIAFDFYKNGDFYDNLMIGTNFDRKQCKIEYNKYTNSNDKEYKRNHIFTQKLESMGHKDMADYIINSSNIWHILEHMETIVLWDICRNCISEQIPFIRQHDGFLTTKDSISKIENILSYRWDKIFIFKKEIL